MDKPRHFIPPSSPIHADFSCPLSIPSQPPDVRNWFSNYEYESPDSSDVPHYIGSFELPETDDSETQDPRAQDQEGSPPAVKVKCFPENDRDWLMDSQNLRIESRREYDGGENGSVEGIHMFTRGNLDSDKKEDGDDHTASGNESKVEGIILGRSFVKDEDFVRRLSAGSDEDLSNKISKNEAVLVQLKNDGSDNGSTGDFSSYPIANVGSAKDPEETHEKPVAGLKRKHRLLQVFEDEQDETMMNRNDTKSKMNDDMQNVKQLVAGPRNQRSKENASADGFVSTKKRGSIRSSSTVTNHNSVATADRAKARGTPQDLMRSEPKENNRILAGKEQSQAARGSAVLADRTNVHQVEVEQGSSGKWLCPRKNKPYVGPPMKQLGLERWVRRVN